jgi:gliding motility associated protien GldN
MAGEGKGYGKLKSYTYDSIATPYTIDEIKARGGHSMTVTIQPDPINNPDYTIDRDTVEAFDWSKITRYIISEEWIFDKQRSQFFPRIIAFAPLFKQTVNGVELAEQTLCWINYAEFRKVAINEEIFNRTNDAMRLTYNDFFEDRLFSSYITKESNEFDAAIRELPEFKDDPMGALYESERIKDNLFNWEHDLWEY